MTGGYLQPGPWAEADYLQRTAKHRVFILVLLWHAESDVVKFNNIWEWITIVEDKVATKIKALEIFKRLRTTRDRNDAGAHQTDTGPAGGGFVLQVREAATNDTDTGSNIDTVDKRETLIPKVGDTEQQQQLMLCPDDMSRLVATSTGQFNPQFTPVGHPGRARTVIGQRGQKHHRSQRSSCEAGIILLRRPTDDHPSP